MVEDTRVLVVESEKPLGQFFEYSVGELVDNDVSVTEIDPNRLPDSIVEVSE